MSLTEFNLTDLLAGTAQQEEDRPRILPEAAIERLRERFAIYRGELPFKPGDLVTPRKDAYYRNHGLPYIVLETEPFAKPRWDASDSIPTFGARFDMRVAHIADNDILAGFWVESWQFEAYAEE